MKKPMMGYGKIAGQTAVGAAVAAILVWYWNAAHPEMQMTAEVAVAVGTLAGPAVKYLVGWLPDPGSFNGEV